MVQKIMNENNIKEDIDMYAVLSSNGRFQYISSSAIDYIGYTNDELVGKPLKEYVHKEDNFLLESFFFNAHHLYPCSFRFISKSGDYIWFETTVDFIKSKLSNTKDYEVILNMKLCQNNNEIIEEYNQHSETIPQEDQWDLAIDHFIESLPCPTFIMADGKIRSANKSFQKLLGANNKEQLIDSDILTYIDKDYHSIVKNRIVRLKAGLQVGLIEQSWKRMDGSPIDVEIKEAPITYDGEKASIAILLDISSRKRFQQILQKSRERYQLLIQNSIDTIAVIHQGNWVFMNESGVKLFAADDYPNMLGKSIYEYLHECDHEHTTETLKRILDGTSEVEVTKQSWITAKKNTVYTEMVCIPTTYFGEQAVQVILRDLSDRKHAEQLLIRSEKLSVAGQLAAGIAHEIRNPLTAIKGFLQLMQPEKMNVDQYFNIIFSELNRIELILSELLMLAKPQEISYRTSNIVALVKDVATLIETEANLSNVMIEQNYEESALLVNCDENQLKQVFINLLKNAIDAMPKGGTVTLSARVVQQMIEITVQDEGEGMEAEVLNRIGEPFLTTKEKGTGLGLMITYKIIDNHRGSVKIESEVGKGTKFIVSLPVE
ncbi:PAS domain S-box protein [Metabacillus fastidiosus]|uniref:PAS domain S-box protein n=1 Tax=Metabacillus fastidiosus TaxID=1458 RepID=UPI000824B6BE|nr:PAS domain S-box protein [Metabacillus fastidiosus]MED4463533.1 PAS domain S-box protein [Metabacillus fastidiosus]